MPPVNENSSARMPAAAIPDVEELANSDDPELVEARAKLLKAQAGLLKANTPLYDKLVIRGLIPIALAIVAPWATWTFSEKTDRAISKTEELQKSLETQREYLTELEARKAQELAAMSRMVNRLDATMKASLIQMAVMQTIAEAMDEEDEFDDLPTQDEIVEEMQRQMAIPGFDPQEVENLTRDAYNRMEFRKGGK